MVAMLRSVGVPPIREFWEVPRSPEPEHPGKMVRRLRLSLGLSQDQLATHVGVGQSAVTGWEMGRSYPVRENWRILDAALGLEEGTFRAAVRQYEDWEEEEAANPIPGASVAIPRNDITSRHIHILQSLSWDDIARVTKALETPHILRALTDDELLQRVVRLATNFDPEPAGRNNRTDVDEAG